MNTLTVAITVVAFILLGVNRVVNIKRVTKTLYEATQFIVLVKNNIRFSSMDYEGLVQSGKNEGYLYISFENEPMLSKSVGEGVQREFNGFIKKLGTTDALGQVAYCDEYYEKFKGYYNESLKNEKGKVSVSAAMSVLSVVCVILLGG